MERLGEDTGSLLSRKLSLHELWSIETMTTAST